VTLPAIPQSAARLRGGEVTAVDLARTSLAAIDRRAHDLHAFVIVDRDGALKQAAQADRDVADGVDHGPLQGIPIAIKDMIDVAGMPTACGSAILAGHKAQSDATVVHRLRAAGAVIIGKTATYEFAMVGPDASLPQRPACNPWHAAHITGGSSSGSAAAIAGGMVRAALGTDTGGSIRSPASYCGVVGLKPSFGRVPRTGVFPLSPGLDHVGPMAATVHEAAMVLDVLSGPCPGDTASLGHDWRSATGLIGQDMRGKRVGYARQWFVNDPACDPAVIRAMDDAVSHLSLLGLRIEEITLPDYALYDAAGAVILHAEALATHRDLIAKHADQYGQMTLQCLAFGSVVTDADLTIARRAAAHLSGSLTDYFNRMDVIVTPTTLGAAPPFSAFADGKAVWTPMRTIPFNLTGTPVLSLPMGFCGGLPLGMQIAGAMGADDVVCAVGHAFERATDHCLLTPQA
jgi:aspartyl-tRNA(Asn)/glutamyl-tRNA(Gln) amidotransferase subunit A